MLSGQDDFQQFAIVGPADDLVLDARRLHPARPGNQALPPHAFELGLEPALEAVDHLELHVVMVPDAEFGPERRGHADHMRLRQAARRPRHAEVAVSRVVAQAAGLEGGLVGMADDKALRRCHAEPQVVDRLPRERGIGACTILRLSPNERESGSSQGAEPLLQQDQRNLLAGGKNGCCVNPGCVEGTAPLALHDHLFHSYRDVTSAEWLSTAISGNAICKHSADTDLMTPTAGYNFYDGEGIKWQR